NKGEHAQFTQEVELTGSIIQSDKPVGLLAGHRCLDMPMDYRGCDHAEQMVPPIRALGHEYVGVGYRPRSTGEQWLWRVVGDVDGTKLTGSPSVGGPSSLERGEAKIFTSPDPFVVKSQDENRPFMLFAYMTGSEWGSLMTSAGDPDFVVNVPPDQYLSRYVF